MTMDREKEREIELESAMYTNCLLLGLDPSITGIGANNSTPRVGLFRHSNPKLGEQLLYFILSSLRGPVQSAKDFDKVWPIFDSAQSRDFRKVVQSIISELESQGALPRSNSRVSSLATCCGPRFVELLWQLSLHALREVHRRTFAADVASNPLPASLTDVAVSHAATLLPVTKARIALERRKFLENAEIAVQRQAMWSSLAHEMTAEFRGYRAEEAYLQQELEKQHDLRNDVKCEGELWDELVSSSSQNSHLVQKATRLWDSLLARQSQHEILASGPIEDLIAHREHRYRISGSSLLAAMDESSQVPYNNALDDKERTDGSCPTLTDENPISNVNSPLTQPDEVASRSDERSSRSHPTVDIAEILRRWTHALQRIHKQSLQLAKANDGEGPELLRSAQDGSTGGHAESLAAALAEHKQHLASTQVLINQIKDVAPAIQSSITELTEEVNSLSSNLPPMNRHCSRSTLPNQESGNSEVGDATSRSSSVQLEKVSASLPALKLPPLFSLTPNYSGKGGNVQKRSTTLIDGIPERNSVDQNQSQAQIISHLQDKDQSYVQNIKRSVREAALALQSCHLDSSHDSQSDDSSEHYFVPLTGTGFSRHAPDRKQGSVKSKLVFGEESNLLYSTKGHHNPPPADGYMSNYKDFPDLLSDVDEFDDNANGGSLSALGSNNRVRLPPDAHRSFYDMEGFEDQVFSPPLLMDTSLLDGYEDLLAPLSETDAAMIE
ncbi:AUGMIN subunit 6 [Impatiens glandulifera]|uniref:AUGMIN subunit 6 n=1 Tax=Impatiens glandulifera TaxID=253017 RepID=UPI001FB0CC98|nr:AUGMIN subunit 6 [Impatiens glandulifera]